MSEEPLLNPEEVASVLAGVEGSDMGPTGSDEGGASTYSLRDPVIIPPNEVDNAKQKMERFTAGLQTSLAMLLGIEITIDFEGFQQQKITTALGVIPPPQWVISFRHEQPGGVALVLPPVLAMVLMELSLGGVGTAQDEGREPTALERRVMTQFLHSLTPTLNSETGLKMTSGEFECGGIPISFGDPGETVGVTLARFKLNEMEQTGLILANGGFLNDGMGTHETAGIKIGPLASRLERLPARIQPILKGGKILMRDLIAMRKGEVLKLDTPEETELSLRIGNTKIFTGRIGRDETRPFFAVTERIRPTETDGSNDKTEMNHE